MPACYQRATERNLFLSLSCCHIRICVFPFREKSENPNDGQGPSRRRIRLYHPWSQGLRRFTGRREEYEDSRVRIVSRVFYITFSHNALLRNCPPPLSFFPSFPGLHILLLLSPVPRIAKGERGRKEDCKVGSRPRGDLLASCYFCIPVNRVWNPICLFATASKLPQQRQPRVVPLPILRASLVRSRIQVRLLFRRAHTCKYADTRARAQTR